MKFIVTFEISPDARRDATTRFLEAGAPPPAGVTMLGRWHDVSMSRGFLLAESDSAEALATWTNEWADILVFEVVPVVDDEEAARVVSS